MKDYQTNKNQSSSSLCHKRRYIILTILILLTIPIFFFVYIRLRYDPKSEKIIRQSAASQLNKDPNELTGEDFAQITELSFSGVLSDIRMLEKFTNLQYLDLWGCLEEKNIPQWIRYLGRYGIVDLSQSR